MCKISVLMSVYNENEKEIFESITSILNQTYSDFELIVIVDNPEISNLSTCLTNMGICDDRIKILYNDHNLGLAESMNKAFAISKGIYIARMDADDICLPTRFEEEVIKLQEGVDLVCTDYFLIDESSNIINKTPVSYSNKTIQTDLIFGNIIHHPTVMMKREIFSHVNGYRNFPCSQDYDLWLRILENGGKIEIINKPLLEYRIRSNSITSSKSFKQIATIWYIQKLYKERKKYGKDTFSIENYNLYLNTLNINNEEYLLKLEDGKKEKNRIDKIKTNNKIYAFLLMIRLAIRYPFYRMLYIRNFNEILCMKINKMKVERSKDEFKSFF